MTAIKQTRYLRRTIRPYTGQIIIISLVTFGALLVSIKTNEWGLFLAMTVAWLLLGILVFIGMKYKISWTSEEVCQRASGGPEACIMYEEITDLGSEVSKRSEMFSISRPFRRIVISGNGNHKQIDVSLRHFRDEDVLELMKVIHSHRPDLSLPKGFT